MKGGVTVREQQSGLRFDIYERVHLPEEVPAIRELDEVELTPQIQVAVQGDQAVVSGYLLLTGSYSGQAGAGTREGLTLEHTIPVEITLPISRIRSVEDISVAIDNFDVDLLSPNSLNVTGVLSLNGIEMVSADAGSWREEEEVVFIHENARTDESSEFGELELPSKGNDAPVAHAIPEVPAAPVFAASPPPQAEEPEQQEIPSAEVTIRRDQLPDDTFDDFEALEQYDDVSAAAPADEEEAVEASAPEDKGELKIAFGSKKGEASPSIDLKSYLGKSDDYRKSAAPPASESAPSATSSLFRSGRGYRSEPEPIPELTPETGGADVLEWKNLFLSSNEEQQFRKVRLCIVHKDDTVESIARKYDRKPQEIRLYNSLSDQEVTEGQVIYIP